MRQMPVFDANEGWVRAARTPSFRKRLLFDRLRKFALALQLYPQRVPCLLADRRAINRSRSNEQSVIRCSLGSLRIDNPHARAQLREILTSGAYAARGFIPKSGWNVVDVGANLGFFSAWAASWMRSGAILAIEAIPETYAFLSANVASIERPGLSIKALNIAVTDMPKSLEFAVPDGYSNYARTTEHLGKLEGFAGIAQRTVGGDSLDNILEREGFPSGERSMMDLLKVDVEGSEVDCLAGAAQSLPHTKRVVLEYHSSELLDRSGAILAQAGFREAWRRPGFLSGDVGISFWRKRKSL